MFKIEINVVVNLLKIKDLQNYLKTRILNKISKNKCKIWNIIIKFKMLINKSNKQ